MSTFVKVNSQPIDMSLRLYATEINIYLCGNFEFKSNVFNIITLLIQCSANGIFKLKTLFVFYVVMKNYR